MTPRIRPLIAGLVLAMAAATLSAAPQRHGPRGALVTIPAGTILNVRLTQAIDVDYAAPGATYHALLADPVMMGRAVVIPYGAHVVLQAVDVRQSGRFKGSDKITLTATLRLLRRPVRTPSRRRSSRARAKARARRRRSTPPSEPGLVRRSEGSSAAERVPPSAVWSAARLVSWPATTGASTSGFQRRRGFSFS